ncbi:unnamed protein product [Camellia sinensis]
MWEDNAFITGPPPSIGQQVICNPSNRSRSNDGNHNPNRNLNLPTSKTLRPLQTPINPTVETRRGTPSPSLHSHPSQRPNNHQPPGSLSSHRKIPTMHLRPPPRGPHGADLVHAHRPQHP